MAHLQEVHRRIFQDLPEHRPGEFRSDAPGHFKNRELESSSDRVLVPYALRPEIDRNLGPTLAVLDGGKAIKGYDMLEMSEAVAQTYGISVPARSSARSDSTNDATNSFATS